MRQRRNWKMRGKMFRLSDDIEVEREMESTRRELIAAALANDPNDQKSAPNLQTGPYLSAALIAEKILTERDDNATSIIRIVDKIGISPESISSHKENVLGFPLVVLVSFRAGGYRGESVLLLVQVSPSGESEPVGLCHVQFDGTPNGLYDLKLPLSMVWHGPGRYWYDVYLDNKLLSRIPFEVAIGDASGKAEK